MIGAEDRVGWDDALRSGCFRETVERGDASGVARAYASLATGELGEAERAARAGLEDEADVRPWLAILAHVAHERGQSRTAMALARRMEARAGDDGPAAVLGLLLRSRSFAQLGDAVSSRMLVDRAARRVAAEEDPWLEGRVALAEAAALAFRDPPRAVDRIERARTCFGDDPYWQARCGVPEAAARRMSPEASLAHFGALLDPAGASGDVRMLAMIHVGLARAWRDLGEADRALEHSREVERVALPQALPLGLYGQAMAHRSRGEIDIADPLFRRALALPGLTVLNRRMLALPGLAEAARRRDSATWDRRFVWVSLRGTETRALWEAFDDCVAAGLDDGRLARLGAAAWEASSPELRLERAPSLHAHTASGLPCGAFLLQAAIGAGGMAHVWRAVDPSRPEEPVAVKLLAPHLAANPRGLDRFGREVQALATLEHPGILPVLDRGITPAALEEASGGAIPGGVPWMAMPLAGGGALTAWCGRRDWSDVAEVCERLLDALASAHARGVLHLDLKPDNVLLATAQRPWAPWLADFGLARATWESHPTGIAGTPAYMPPEQFRADWRSWGPPTDLYALGCTIWELVTGHPPYRGDLRALRDQHTSAPLPELAPVGPVPEGLGSWLARLLAKDPRDRFPDAASARAAFAALGGAAGAIAAGPVGEGSPATFDLDDIVPAGSSEVRASEVPVVAGDSLPPLAVWTPEPIRSTRVSNRLVPSVREVPLIGRDAAKDRVWHAFRAAVDVGPQALVVHARPGMGAGRLAEWLTHQVLLGGHASVLRARFAEVPGALTGLEGMVRAFTRAQGLEGEALDRWLERCPWRPPDLSAGELRRALDADTDPILALPLLTALARVRPVVLVFEAAQWSGGSLMLVRSVLASRLPILALVTVQSEPGADAARHLRLLELSDVPRIEMGPLGGDAAATLADSVLPLILRQRSVLVEATGGVPGRILAALRDWTRREILEPVDDRFRVPDAELEALREGVAATTLIPEHLPVAATLLAVLGGAAARSEVEALATHLGVPAELESLLAEGWASEDHDRFTLSDAVRVALLERAAVGGELAGLHRAAAAILDPESGPWIALRKGRHLVAGGEPDAATGPLLSAARQLSMAAAGAVFREWEEAMLAAQIPEDDPRWLEGFAARVDGLFVDGRSASELGPQLDALEARGTHEQRAVARLARTQLRDAPESHEVWEDIATDPRLSGPLRARAALHLSYRTLHQADREGSRRWAALADDLIPADHALRLAVLQLEGLRLQQEGDLQGARVALEAAIAVAPADHRDGRQVMHAWSVLGDVHRGLGDMEAAERAYRRSLQLSRAFADTNQYVAELNLAILDLHRGRIARHTARLPGLARDARSHSWPVLAVFAELLTVALEVSTPEVVELVARVRRELAAADYVDVELAELGAGLARFLDEEGRLGQAAVLRAFAADQWRAVGRPDEAARLE